MNAKRQARTRAERIRVVHIFFKGGLFNGN